MTKIMLLKMILFIKVNYLVINSKNKSKVLSKSFPLRTIKPCLRGFSGNEIKLKHPVLFLSRDWTPKSA